MVDTIQTDSLKRNLSNPQRVYMWDVLIPNPVGEGDPETLSVRAFSTSKPGKSFGEITIPYHAGPGFKVPGKLTMTHKWECTFQEGEDTKVHRAIDSWMQHIVHNRLNVGIGDILIKKDIRLKLLSTTGAENLQIKIIGCYPENIGDVALDQTTEDTVKYAVTFSYDNWESV